VSPELASTTPSVGRQSFWAGGTNVLKALAGLATAVAALLTVLHQAGVIGRSGNGATTATPTVVTTAAPATRATPTTTTTPAEPRGPDTAALRTYVDELDLLLLNSGDTRGVLNETLTAVGNGTISREVALSRIDEVIDDRRTLLDQVSTKPTPEEFREARRLLREAISFSIAVDRAAHDFVDASFAGDSEKREAARAKIVSGSERATATKAAFTRAYNANRADQGVEPFAGPI
jgi:hypothetical protein